MSINEGDKVAFNLGRNELTGTVQQTLTNPQKMGGVTIHASEDDPQLLIKHDNTGTLFNRHPDKVKDLGGEGMEEEQGPSEGEKVKFNIGRNENVGVIKEKLTEPREVAGHMVYASEQDPQFIIEHEKTGTEFNRHADKVKDLHGES